LCERADHRRGDAPAVRRHEADRQRPPRGGRGGDRRVQRVEVDLRRLLGRAAAGADRYGRDMKNVECGGHAAAVKSGGMAAALQIALLLIASSAFAQTVPEQLIQRELASSQAYETLSHLTDDIGQRLSGSPGAAAAVRFTTERFRAWGIDVRNERVAVPHWVRGREEARLVSQHDQKIVLTAIGSSV